MIKQLTEDKKELVLHAFQGGKLKETSIEGLVNAIVTLVRVALYIK